MMGKHKYGDRILVKDSVVDLFVERIFINETPNRLAVCVKVNQEKLFEERDGFDTEEWQFHKPIPKEIFVAYTNETFPLDNSGMVRHKEWVRNNFASLSSISESCFVLTNTDITFNFEIGLNHYEWLNKDGTTSPFGHKKTEGEK